MALRPKNEWALSGLPCRPCRDKNESAPAWVARCLRHVSMNYDEEACFTLWGNATTIQAAWLEAMMTNRTRYKITIRTTDPVGEMKKIREKLRVLLDVQVLTQPCVVIFVDGFSNITTTTWISSPSPTEDGLNIVGKTWNPFYCGPGACCFVCYMLSGLMKLASLPT